MQPHKEPGSLGPQGGHGCPLGLAQGTGTQLPASFPTQPSLEPNPLLLFFFFFELQSFIILFPEFISLYVYFLLEFNMPTYSVIPTAHPLKCHPQRLSPSHPIPPPFPLPLVRFYLGNLKDKVTTPEAGGFLQVINIWLEDFFSSLPL